MTIAFIRRHIFRLPLQKLFTTREFLIYGKRPAIDKGLSRLVKKGVIIRICRGVFIRAGSKLNLVSPFDVARAKSESYGKKISHVGGHFAQELGLLAMDSSAHVYAVNGSSSSFKLRDITIHLRKTSVRKMQFGDSLAGKIIRALWDLGKHSVDVFVVDKALRSCLRYDLHELRQSLCALPTWLSTYFVRMTLPRAAFENYPPICT